MKILVLSHQDVVDLLSVEACIPLMEDLFKALARGQVFQPLRVPICPPTLPGLLGLMPACLLGEAPVLGLKAVCVFQRNSQLGKDAHQGSMLLFSAETGELQAVLNASAITAIRTAAVSGVATRCLARLDADELAIIGSGPQAGPHLQAMLAARNIRRTRVASRSFEHARRFAQNARRLYGVEVDPAPSVEAAVRDAGIVVTVTSSTQPVVKAEWVARGTHLNVVGGSRADAREVDSRLMAAASLFVDRRESAANESGDYLVPLQEGAIGPDHIRAELGEVLLGLRPGRTTEDEITLFDSVGLAAQDVAAASHVVQQAKRARRGSWVDY